MNRVEQQVLNGHIAPVRRDKRRRYTFRFMLDVMHDNQLLLAEELDVLKRQRKYTATILNALSLFQDLKKGSTKLLRQMFPGIVQSIESEYAVLHKPVMDVASFEERIRNLEQRLMSQPVPAQLPAPVQSIPTLTGSAFVKSTPEDIAGTRKSFVVGMGDLFASADEDLWN